MIPWLSSWWVQRKARLREKRFVATITKMQERRMTATDKPVPPGILKDLVGKCGEILNGKAWSDNGWRCGQDWLGNGNWVSRFFTPKSHGPKNGGGEFGSDEHCLAEKSYSRFSGKELSAFFLSIMWRLRKIFRCSSSDDDASVDAEQGSLLDRSSENAASCQERKAKNAQRKAEKLVREQLEEGERKQRKLRDEKKEAEKDRGKSSPAASGKDARKEAEKKRPEKKRENDRGSCKSNLDADNREDHKTGIAHVIKSNNSTTDINNRNAGSSNRERMGSTNSSGSVSQKPNGSLDPSQVPNNRKYFSQPERVPAKSNATVGDDKNMKRPALMESQQSSEPKKSRRQLFTESSSVPSSSTSNVISKPESCGSVSQKPKGSLDQPQVSNNRKDFSQSKRVPVKPNATVGDDKNTKRPVLMESHSSSAPKKSRQPSSAPKEIWRRKTACSSSTSNVIRTPETEIQSPPLTQSPPTQKYGKPINLGSLSPSTLSRLLNPASSTNTTPVSPPESTYSRKSEACELISLLDGSGPINLGSLSPSTLSRVLNPPSSTNTTPVSPPESTYSRKSEACELIPLHDGSGPIPEPALGVSTPFVRPEIDIHHARPTADLPPFSSADLPKPPPTTSPQIPHPSHIPVLDAAPKIPHIPTASRHLRFKQCHPRFWTDWVSLREHTSRFLPGFPTYVEPAKAPVTVDIFLPLGPRRVRKVFQEGAVVGDLFNYVTSAIEPQLEMPVEDGYRVPTFKIIVLLQGRTIVISPGMETFEISSGMETFEISPGMEISLFELFGGGWVPCLEVKIIPRIQAAYGSFLELWLKCSD